VVVSYLNGGVTRVCSHVSKSRLVGVGGGCRPSRRGQCHDHCGLVNSAEIITLGNQVIQIGSPLAGQRARVRLDGQVMHVLTQDGILWRTLPCPIQPGQRHRLQGVRLAGPDPLAETTVRVFDQHGEVITIVPRNGTGEISRFKAYGTATCQWCWLERGSARWCLKEFPEFW
jgi:hypothetical protein